MFDIGAAEYELDEADALVKSAQTLYDDGKEDEGELDTARAIAHAQIGIGRALLAIYEKLGN